MMKIEHADLATITELWEDVLPDVKQSNCLEEAARMLAKALYSRFSDSAVLARVFVTTPFDTLPKNNKEFVKERVASAGLPDTLTAATPVLSLIGTHGLEADWCDRRKSKAHLGIPLVSSAFVGEIPMISRLLRELNVPMDYLDSHKAGIIIETIGRRAGLFFVADAAEATDSRGRRIITAQDFVYAYQVKGVFGVGGAYDNGQILITILFCRDSFPRSKAEDFLSLGNLFQSQTNALVNAHRIFADE